MTTNIKLLLLVYSQNAKTQNYCLFNNNEFLTRNIAQLDNTLEMFEDVMFTNYNSKISVYENFKKLNDTYKGVNYDKLKYIKKYILSVENRILFLYNKLLKNS